MRHEGHDSFMCDVTHLLSVCVRIFERLTNFERDQIQKHGACVCVCACAFVCVRVTFEKDNSKFKNTVHVCVFLRVRLVRLCAWV